MTRVRQARYLPWTKTQKCSHSTHALGDSLKQTCAGSAAALLPSFVSELLCGL